jgi:hypothetical protein
MSPKSGPPIALIIGAKLDGEGRWQIIASNPDTGASITRTVTRESRIGRGLDGLAADLRMTSGAHRAATPDTA